MPDGFDQNREIIAQTIINEIYARDQNIDTKIGQPIRRVIVDPFSTIFSDIYFQDYLTNLNLEIDTSIGKNLDNLAKNFGMARKQGTFAAGIVTCSINVPHQTQDYTIQAGTYFSVPTTSTNAEVIFLSTETYTLAKQTTAVDIPVTALETGVKGNVLANTVVKAIPAIQGITTITNILAFSGGTDPETDAEFRSRFKNTVLKGIVGTEDSYQNVALDNLLVSAVNVIETMEIYEEEVQLTGTSNANLRFSNLYANSETIMKKDKTILYIKNTDYTIDYSAGIIARTSGSNIASGDIVNVKYEFNPTYNRGVGTVDIYLKGSNLTSATEEHIFEAGVTNYYLAKPPVVDLPASINVYNTDYTFYTTLYEGTNYSLSNESTGASLNLQNSKKDGSKIVFSTTYTGKRFKVENYVYDKLIYDIQEEIDKNKQITSDVLVHFGNKAYLNIYLDIILEIGQNQAAATSAVVDSLTEFLDSLGFFSAIQFSDIVENVHSLLAVDNAKCTKINYGSDYTTDIYLDFDKYPVLNNVFITWKTRGTF